MPLSRINAQSLTDGTIVASEIADGAIATAKIADDAITGAKISNTENFFIGNTAEFVDGTGTGDKGIQLNPLGLTVSTRNGGISGIFGRQASDGQIVQFRKDGASIGAIGITSSTNDIYINSVASNHKGLRFGSGAIVPTDNSGGTDDNATNLGGATQRFKDLYLSSGVRVGGTGTANLLDDYEEGTFDVVITGTTGGTATGATGAGSGASYVKIGETVFYRGYFANPVISGTLSGDLRIGLPFTNANNNRFDNGAGGFVVGTREISSGSTTNIITLKSSRGDNFARLRRCFTLNNRSEDENLSQATASINTSTLIWFQGILKV